MARNASGSAVLVVGESGIGKSRLADAVAEAAFAADMRILRGRGSAVGPMVPFRSLTEALMCLVRTGDPVDVAELGPYRPILSRLIPDWGDASGASEDGSLVVLAEAVLRLTSLAGRENGCLIVLDDLHDTDAETLAVIEYLIDNLRHQPTLLVGTVRDEPSPGLELALAVAQRGTATLLELHPLPVEDLRDLAASWLEIKPEAVPAPVVDLLAVGSAGNPLLAEQVLDGIVSDGFMVRRGDGWALTEELTTGVPPTLTRSVARRLDQLGPQGYALLSVAAMLGSRFPLAVAQAVTGLDDRHLLSILQGAVAGHLVAPDEETPDWYVFQHSLVKDAVLSLLAPGERARLASKAADAIEAVYPGLPGEWCQASAALRLRAGDNGSAGRLLIEAGRRALAQGAAVSTVALLNQAWDVISDDDDGTERGNALEALLYALAEAGLVERALSLTATLDEVGVGLGNRRRAQLYTRLAWAAAVAGRTADALAQVETARTLLGPDAAPEDTAPVDVVAAHLALDLPGPDQLATAESLARRAALVAESIPLPVVACQGWQLLGSLARHRDLDEATACLERARSTAVRHHLRIWEIHALIRLGNDDALREGGLERLEQARSAAVRAGAVTAGYQAELNIAQESVLHGDFAAAEDILDQVLPATCRLKLLETTQYLLMTRAALAAHQGRRREMEKALTEFRHWDGDSARHAPRLHGLVRAFCALLEEDRPRALAELSIAVAAQRENPTVFQLSGQHGLHALLLALAGELDWAGYEEITAAPSSRLRWNRHFALLARAVLVGRAGDAEQAARAVSEAELAGGPYAMAGPLALRLISDAALADGWGTPVEWLRSAEKYFHETGGTAVASACRALLRQAGAPVPQRRTGVDLIPDALRSAGVTVREYEILLLITERLGNRQIADRLHLSPRTVEKHVASMLAKTGLPGRVALSEFAARALAD